MWSAATQIGAPFGRIVQLLILTGQRKSEIGELTWSYISEDTVALPSAITKNGHEHTFPLGDVAKSLLPKRGEGYLFRATGSEERYNGYYYHLKKLQEISETSGWTLHDLRRTFATNLSALGVPIHVTEKLLNHRSGTLNGVAAIYNRHAYMDEMRQAIKQWELHLTDLLARSSGNGPH